MVSEYRGLTFSDVTHPSFHNFNADRVMAPPTHPRLSASYVPGRDGDICMPDVVSPSPQRIMLEVPSNMQEGLAQLELESHQSWNSSKLSSLSSKKSTPTKQSHSGQTPKSTMTQGGYNYTNQWIYQNLIEDHKLQRSTESVTFNPFPRTQSLGMNVPLSDEEKGEVLEKVRRQVLKSTDPNVQLAWAQNTLLWADIENENARRTAPKGQLTRSMTPKIERQLREDAINIVRHLGEQGHPKAEFIKAYWLEFGKFGNRMDKKEAFLGYSRAAEKGYARAHYRIGMQYENSNNPVKALEHYNRGVSMHDSASHYRLGMMTLLGQHGTPLDYGRAISLLRFAAETADENSPQGAYVYGMLIAKELPKISAPDKFIPYDIREAKKFIEKGAYLGFAKAQVKMGLAYELCQLSCEFDPTLSLHYNALASRQGEAEADMAISKWFLCGYDGLFEKNEELAFVHAQRASLTQLPMAEFAMGYFYEIGMYVKSDLHESEKWYQKAADHGNVDAVGRIQSIKTNNALSRKDHEQIAVNRIKSRYGSQRGERPDRFRKVQPSTPIAEGEEVNTTSARNSYGSSTPVRKERVDSLNKPYIHPPQVRPDKGEVRGSQPSLTCQEDQDPKSAHGSLMFSPTNANSRPSRMAPYPIYNNLSVDSNESLRTVSNVGLQSDRPQSAFGIRIPLKHLKSNAIGHVEAIRPQSETQLQTSLSTSAVSTNGGRVESIGGPLNTVGWEKKHPEHRASIPYNQGIQGRRYDYGSDLPAPNRLPKLPVVSSPNVNKPRLPQYPDDHQGKIQPSNHLTRPEQLSSPNSNQVQQNSTRLSQRPSQQNIPSQQVSQPQRDSKTASRPLPSPPVTSPKISAPIKTGPATFEEMGIPAANKEGECTVM